ncbi:unnamed protein product, partial [Allacma fusca]
NAAKAAIRMESSHFPSFHPWQATKSDVIAVASDFQKVKVGVHIFHQDGSKQSHYLGRRCCVVNIRLIQRYLSESRPFA